MYQNQMTFNGFPSSASSSSFQPPFFTQGFLFHSPIDDSNHLSPILPSVPWGNSQDFGGAADVWKEEMSAGGGGGGDEELSDDCTQPGGRKRRLSMDQVRTLERNFEFGNKLEPERKLQLAAALGLQPRQIAIWFQNRRARWKTKQLEKDYEMLKREFDVAKSQNDALLAHNSKLQSELFALRGREGDEPINLNKETEGSSSNRSENNSDFNLDVSRKAGNYTKPSSLNQDTNQPFPCYRVAPEPAQVVKNENCDSSGRGRGGNEDTFCSIFGSGIGDEPAAFWPWTDH